MKVAIHNYNRVHCTAQCSKEKEREKQSSLMQHSFFYARTIHLLNRKKKPETKTSYLDIAFLFVCVCVNSIGSSRPSSISIAHTKITAANLKMISFIFYDNSIAPIIDMVNLVANDTWNVICDCDFVLAIVFFFILQWPLINLSIAIRNDELNYFNRDSSFCSHIFNEWFFFCSHAFRVCNKNGWNIENSQIKPHIWLQLVNLCSSSSLKLQYVIKF